MDRLLELIHTRLSTVTGPRAGARALPHKYSTGTLVRVIHGMTVRADTSGPVSAFLARRAGRLVGRLHGPAQATCRTPPLLAAKWRHWQGVPAWYGPVPPPCRLGLALAFTSGIKARTRNWLTATSGHDTAGRSECRWPRVPDKSLFGCTVLLVRRQA